MSSNLCNVGLLCFVIASGALACDRSQKGESSKEGALPEEPGVTETRGANPPGAQPAAPSKTEEAARTSEAPKTAEPAMADAPKTEPRPTGQTPPGAMTTNLPPFEGQVQVKLRGKAPESIDYAMKGDKIRLGITATPGNNDKGVDAIIDTRDKTATVLFNDRKEFVEVDLEKLAKRASARAESVQVEKTGETDTVDGRECEQWRIKDPAAQLTACVVKGGPYFDLGALEERLGFTAPGWLHKVIDSGYIPLRVSVDDAKGERLGSSHVSEYSRNVDKSKFDIPVGYKKADSAKLPGTKK